MFRRGEHENRLGRFRDLAVDQGINQQAVGDQGLQGRRRESAEDDVGGGNRQPHAEHQRGQGDQEYGNHQAMPGPLVNHQRKGVADPGGGDDVDDQADRTEQDGGHDHVLCTQGQGFDDRFGSHAVGRKPGGNDHGDDADAGGIGRGEAIDQ